jgi:diguanylate cyclase (GGDEF)-like protein/PAS domain S-box-containing protein
VEQPDGERSGGTPEHADALIAALRDGVLMLDRHGRIIDLNDAMCALTGFPREDLLGRRPPFPAIGAGGDTAPDAEDSVAGVPCDRSQVREGTSVIRHRSGDPVAVLVTVAPARDRDGAPSGWVATFRDRSPEIRARAGLLDTEERYRSIVETAVDGIITIDGAGLIRSFNPAAERIFGLRAAEVVGREVTVLMPEPYRSEHPGYLQRYARSGERRIIGIGRQVVGLRADGSTFPLHLSVGEMVVAGERFFTGTVRDLSDLRWAEEHHRSIVETAVDAIITIDESGAIDTVNPAATRLFGYSAAEMVGRNVSMLMPEPYAGEHDDYLARYLAEGSPRIIGIGRRVTGRRKSGELFPMHLSVGEMWVGGRRAFTGLVRDETAAVAAEIELRRARDEQEALRQLAMTVALEASPDVVFAQAAEIVGRLLDVDFGMVARFLSSEADIVGTWTRTSVVVEPRRALRGDGALVQVHRTGEPAVVEDYSALPGGSVDDPAVAAALRSGCAASVAYPVRVSGALWGAVLAATLDRSAMPDAAIERLGRIAHLVGLAVANAEVRARLASQAMTDPLTGLANHRAFHERLHAEVERARRHGRSLALAVLDIDHFKAINDEFGHQAGDGLVSELGARLSALARPGDLIARIGGDEFAWILPETDGIGGFAAVERGRADISGRRLGTIDGVTLSAGVCDLSFAERAEDLVRFADGALYWAKEHGRDVTYLYSPEVVREMSAAERVQRHGRRHALAGHRAQAVDAKDALTSRHSERVADIASAIAGRLGWPEGRRAQLVEAGLLHDVGKIGVPDSILFKPGPLTDDEFEVVKTHPALGAQIAGEVLDDDQVRWIHEHHERVDGRGYPSGLSGTGISDGGRILALADAWDVMTSPRIYSAPLSRPDAVAEIQRCAGSQFDPEMVRALVAHLGERVDADHRGAPRG